MGAKAVATASYQGCSGPFDGQPCVQNGTGVNNSPRDIGLLVVQACRRFRDITDGTSNVFAVGEVRWIPHANDATGTVAGSDRQFIYGHVTTGGGPKCNNNGVTNDGTHLHLRWCRERINAPFLAASNLDRSFHSQHVGGAHFLMADGSVHFISQNINHTNTNFSAAKLNGPYGTYQQLSAINDGQVVSQY
jgi:hypothetical protein